MGWIKRMRLKNALFAMMFFGLLLASLLSIGAFIGCNRLIQTLPQATASIEISSNPSVTIIHPEASAPPAWSQAVGSLLGVLLIALPILIFTLVILLTSILFYRTKLKEPLHILKSSTERIMQDDLDFVIPAPSGQDELGQLCGAFEKMRENLLANNQTLWRQAEERKRLNAAFAHDLRNPVTVLKGTAKLLRKGICDEQTIGRLEDYTLRIEQYIESMSTIQRLEEALHSAEFGASRMADTLCQQLLIDINRDIRRDARIDAGSYQVDPKIEEILRYIAGHLEEDLTVDALAGRFYLSRYYLMHRFKAVTGCTIHQYISQKRLLRAGELIRSGTPVMKAAEQVGFSEYSTFLRAFRSTFHMNPREFR